ncbi:MAG: DUF5615 family PIN-like protein [Planctomycetia bacterium]|nr:DUF5615 family PIN-like protein [Planctomycetia bacterium]
MTLRYVLDENVTVRLLQAVRRHNIDHELSLDVVRVGEPDDLPLQSADPEILRWAEREGRILVTNDTHTMQLHLDEHLRRGGHSPGIFMIRRGARIATLLEFLVAAAYASEPHEWHDRIEFIL